MPHAIAVPSKNLTTTEGLFYLLHISCSYKLHAERQIQQFKHAGLKCLQRLWNIFSSLFCNAYLQGVMQYGLVTLWKSSVPTSFCIQLWDVNQRSTMLPVCKFYEAIISKECDALTVSVGTPLGIKFRPAWCTLCHLREDCSTLKCQDKSLSSPFLLAPWQTLWIGNPKHQKFPLSPTNRMEEQLKTQ